MRIGWHPCGGERLRRAAGVLALAAAIAVLGPSRADAIDLPPLFSESQPITGLNAPTAVRFAPDGRVFVAEKRGVIKVFDSLSDETPTVFADLRTNVYNYWDRGLLGMVLDPSFPIRPYLYVLYAHDAAIGGTAPLWGTPGVNSDSCPTPEDGCVVSGRLSRLTVSGDLMAGEEQVLVEDWCQQYPSHSVGDLAFGADGALYVSGGDGGSFEFIDWGQGGSGTNPCDDPPFEGGALRSQDLRTDGDPAGLDGAILRVDPATGEALPGNPLASSPDPNARRVVAYGLRNPFRFTVRPGTRDVWLGDVGSGGFEELNRIANPVDGVVKNFGWPCYEGRTRHNGYDAADLPICEGLYAAGPSAVRQAYFSYPHAAKVVPNEDCPSGTSAISGLRFYNGTSFPKGYKGALFFADFARRCIWVMKAGKDGLPSPSKIETFGADAANPVGLEVGPGGDLFYVDLHGGAIRRIRYLAGNQPPAAVARAEPRSGPAPLTVRFDASDSRDPEGAPLTYGWDLDQDGAFDDSSSATPTRTYARAGSYIAKVRVTDPVGASAEDSVTVTAGNSAPTAAITAPPASLEWGVGEPVAFEGDGTDPEQGSLPPSAFTWQLAIEHCPGGCHTHSVEEFAGVRSGSFEAPDHEYPSNLLLSLTVTDAGGLSDTEQVRISPRTVAVTLASAPQGLQLVLNATQARAPFTRQVIRGSQNTVSAPSPQILSGQNWLFGGWSDGGARTHLIVADEPRTLTASFGPNTAIVSKNGSQLTYQARAGFDNSVEFSLDPVAQRYSFLEPGISAGAGCVLADAGRVDCGGATEAAQVTLNLADGNDVATAAAGAHGRLVMNGGVGSDRLVGGPGADRLEGSTGDDFLDGGAGDDAILGGDLHDDMIGGPGADTFDGGSGTDEVLYTDHAAGVTVDIEPTSETSDDDGNSTDGPVDSRDDVRPTVEVVTGSGAADVISAAAAAVAVTLRGLAGNDVLTDGPKGDTLDGGAGADTINCVNGGVDTNVPDPSDTVNGVC